MNLIANLRMVEKATPSWFNPTGLEWVSVLVPARNEARNIRRCLESAPGVMLVVLDSVRMTIWGGIGWKERVYRVRELR